MCRCSSVPVEVLVCSEVSHSGNDERKVKPIDACIAPLVAALDCAGIAMLGSCCGHGKGDGSILLRDGRELVIVRDNDDFYEGDEHHRRVLNCRPRISRATFAGRELREARSIVEDGLA